MKFLALISVFVLGACGGDIFLHPTSPEIDTPTATTCLPPTGTYLTHWTTLSGDCGDQPDEVLHVQDLLNQITQSTIQNDTWNNDHCTENLDYIYTSPNGEVAHWIDVATCENQECSQLSEQMNITATWGAGQTCSGTYQIDWTKQQ